MKNLALSQILLLTDQALSLHDRLSNHYDLSFAAPTSGDDLPRLRWLIDRAWNRYERRLQRERGELVTQNSGDFVQHSPKCSRCGCFVNYGSWCTRCFDVVTHSGDSARLPIV